MKNWKKIALLGAAAAAMAATGGAAAAPLAAGSASAGAAGAAGAGTAAAGTAGTGAAAAGTGAAGTGNGLFSTSTGQGLLSHGISHPGMGASGVTGVIPGSSVSGLHAPGFNPANLGAGPKPDPSWFTRENVMGGVKDFGNVAQSAALAQNLFPGEQASQPQLSQGNPAGPQTVAQLYQASQQAVQDQINQQQQARLQRRQNWG